MSMKFTLLINIIKTRNNGIARCNYQSQSVILLINIKMSTIVGIFIIYEQDNFHAQLSMESFNNLGSSSDQSSFCAQCVAIDPVLLMWTLTDRVNTQMISFCLAHKTLLVLYVTYTRLKLN